MKFISNGEVVAEIKPSGPAIKLGPENGQIVPEPVSVSHSITNKPFQEEPLPNKEFIEIDDIAVEIEGKNA